MILRHLLTKEVLQSSIGIFLRGYPSNYCCVFRISRIWASSYSHTALMPPSPYVYHWWCHWWYRSLKKYRFAFNHKIMALKTLFEGIVEIESLKQKIHVTMTKYKYDVYFNNTLICFNVQVQYKLFFHKYSPSPNARNSTYFVVIAFISSEIVQT